MYRIPKSFASFSITRYFNTSLNHDCQEIYRRNKAASATTGSPTTLFPVILPALPLNGTGLLLVVGLLVIGLLLSVAVTFPSALPTVEGLKIKMASGSQKLVKLLWLSF
ncbi:uncharacterized protein LY89DRAFT_99033 [Mollisia scopiformis]|uniref:Uncharacterized protein n=1 Tax=Mollisia scopiformis TaxID=149040 RepID=A0A194X6X0_MOLSC|nr:uncharacterized protein LY89DRAFT_99033 [Mollisia scopiformis]KUJ15920.1 hypothetical protein LY89DRAFT_99033 [Mollisia scopiformis]